MLKKDKLKENANVRNLSLSHQGMRPLVRNLSFTSRSETPLTSTSRRETPLTPTSRSETPLVSISPLEGETRK